MYHTAVFLLVKFGVGRHPFCVGGGVVWHPVEPHLKVDFVGGFHQRFEVVDGAIFGIGGLEVGGSVGTVDAASTRVDWHQPNDVNTEIFEVLKSGGGGVESAFLCERTHVEFVDDVVVAGGFGIGYGFDVVGSGALCGVVVAVLVAAARRKQYRSRYD